MRVRKHRADPHPQDLREDRSPLQARAHRPHRQALRPAVVEGCGVPEKRPLSRRLRARRLPGSPEDGRFRAVAGGDSPRDPRKRPFLCCRRRDVPQLLRKRPKVCALIQQGAADPCFVALAICITPGRWRTRFRGAATPKLKRILLAFSDAGGLNARPQSFAVRNKRKTLRFTVGTSPLCSRRAPSSSRVPAHSQDGAAIAATAHAPASPLARAAPAPCLRFAVRRPRLQAPPLLQVAASTPSRGLPARAPPQTAPRDGWGCRRRRWRSGDTWGRNRRARGSRSLPGN